MQKLKNEPVWLCWKYIEDKGKVPFNPNTGEYAKPNDPATWTSYELAKQKSFQYDGIGFALKRGFCAIDIDHAVEDEERKKQADEIINLMNSYTEKSPSRKGYHILFRCDIKQFEEDFKSKYSINNSAKGIECYIGGITNKYLTYTGEAINSLDIEDRTAQLLEFLDKYMRKEQKNISMSDKQVEDLKEECISDEDVIKKAKSEKERETFVNLYYAGDLFEFGNDDSIADFHLCRILAFYTQGNEKQIDRLFRKSKLYRKKWEREDYRENTIKKAILSYSSFYRPNKTLGKKTNGNQEAIKEILRIEDLEQYLVNNGISIRFNEISRQQDIASQDEITKKKYGEHLSNVLVSLVYDDLSQKYKKVSMQIIPEFLNTIGIENRYNPVLDLIDAIKWDGKERLSELYAALGVKDDSLSETLIYKWLHQCISMARNNCEKPYGADGVLCLVGPQGIGKTSFFRKLALKDEFFLEGSSINMFDKDTSIRATSFWITELGEIESTFKRSDIANLKSLITNNTDIYRKPYGKQDVTYVRRTSFCATCNSKEYLIDPTGNRRFWTVPVENIDLDGLNKIDMLQLWAEVNSKAKNDIQGFRLTREDRAALDQRNGEHEKLLPAEDEIRDIISMTENKKSDFDIMDATVSEFKSQYESLRTFTVKALSAALTKLGYVAERKTVNGKQGRYRRLPMPLYFCSSNNLGILDKYPITENSLGLDIDDELDEELSKLLEEDN